MSSYTYCELHTCVNNYLTVQMTKPEEKLNPDGKVSPPARSSPSVMFQDRFFAAFLSVEPTCVFTHREMSKRHHAPVSVTGQDKSPVPSRVRCEEGGMGRISGSPKTLQSYLNRPEVNKPPTF